MVLAELLKTDRIKLSITKIIRATLLCDRQDPKRLSVQKSHLAHCLLQNRTLGTIVIGCAFTWWRIDFHEDLCKCTQFPLSPKVQYKILENFRLL
jgi:hypothetical protein